MAVSTALFAVATGASRLVGMLREAATAWIFTVQGEAINAFTVAYQIPNLIRSLVADAALGAAFVPIFNELLDEGRARSRLARRLDRVVALVRGALGDHGDRDGARAAVARRCSATTARSGVGLARVIFPTVVMLGLNGLQTAILNALDEFFLPAIAPVAWNLVIVGTLVLSLPFLQTTDAAALRVRLRHPARHGRAARDPVAGDAPPRPPASGSATHATRPCSACSLLMLPVTLGLGLINLNLLVNTLFAAGVDPELGPGRRRQGVPHLHAAAGHVLRGGGRRAVPGALAARGGRRRAGLPRARRRGPAPDRVPAAPGRRHLRRCSRSPIVRLLYEHGHFTPARHVGRRVVPRGVLARPRLQRRDAAAEPRLLQHAAGVGADLRRGREPARERHARLGALEPLGIWSIPLATSIANIFGVVPAVPRAAAARRAPRRARAACARSCASRVATVLAAGVAYGVWRGLDALLGEFVPFQF